MMVRQLVESGVEVKEPHEFIGLACGGKEHSNEIAGRRLWARQDSLIVSTKRAEIREGIQWHTVARSAMTMPHVGMHVGSLSA